MNQSVLNMGTSIVGAVVSLAIGLVYTPFLVNSLGVEAYGFIPLAYSLIQYLSFILQTLSAAISQRLISQVNVPASYNRIFSTSVVLCAPLAVMVLVVFWMLLAPFATLVINIPKGLHTEVSWLIVGMGGGFGVSLLSTPFAGVLFSQHQLFIISIVQMLESVIRVVATVAMFLILVPSLFFVSFGIAVASIIRAICLVFAVRWKRPSLEFSINNYDPALPRSLARTSGGVLLDTVGTVLMFNSELFLINHIYGAERGGMYALTMQWVVVLRVLGLSVAANATARVMQVFYSERREVLIAVTARYIRFLGAFVALPTGFIAGVAPDLLSVWLSPEFAINWKILVALSIPVTFYVNSMPLGAIMLAADKTYHSGFSNLITAILFVVVSFSAAKNLHWGGVEVALTLGAALLAKNFIFMIPFASRLAGPGALRSFLFASILPILWISTCYLAAKILASILMPASFLDLTIIGFLTALVFAPVAIVSLPRKDVRFLVHEFVSVIMLMGRVVRTIHFSK